MSNILIVDPDPIIRNMMIQVLSGNGHTVYEAATAQEAMCVCQSLVTDPLDILIFDHQAAACRDIEQLLRQCANPKTLQLSGAPSETLLPGVPC